MTPNRSIPISEKPRLYWKSGLWWAVGLSPAGIIIQEQGLCVQEAYFNWATQHARHYAQRGVSHLAWNLLEAWGGKRS